MSEEKKEENQKELKWWQAILAVIFLIAIFYNYAKDNDSTAPVSNQQPAHEQEQKAEWPNVELNEANVKEALKKAKGTWVVRINDETLKKIEIVDHAGTAEPNDKIVNVHIHPDAIWDEKDYVRKLGSTTAAYGEILHKHPNVSLVRVWGLSTFEDLKGNEKEETAVRIEWSRETASKVSAEKVDDNYMLAYELADAYYIHPGIYRNLKEFSLPAQK